MTEYMTAEKARKNNAKFREVEAEVEDLIKEVDQAIERVSLNGPENKFAIKLFEFDYEFADLKRYRQTKMLEKHYKEQGFSVEVTVGGVPHGAYLKLNWEVRR